MTKITDKFLNILYPRCCPCCHRILADQQALICPECERKLHPITGSRCMKCGRPVGMEEEYCRDCRKHPHIYTAGRGIFLYNEKWKLSLEKYKYYGCREYGDFYAEAMFVYAQKEINRWKPDVIVPVPLHRKKQRMRGFNQSLYLAERIGRRSGIPVDGNMVCKPKATGSQKKLDAAARRRNLQDAFRVQGRPEGMTVLVIDDVYTTGSTIDAMAACLLEKGAKKVYFLTFCIGFQ